MASGYKLGGFHYHHHLQHGHFLSKHRGCACCQLLKTSPFPLFHPRAFPSGSLTQDCRAEAREGFLLLPQDDPCCWPAPFPSCRGRARAVLLGSHCRSRALLLRKALPLPPASDHPGSAPQLPPSSQPRACPPEAGCRAASLPLASPFYSDPPVHKQRERSKEQAKR